MGCWWASEITTLVEALLPKHARYAYSKTLSLATSFYSLGLKICVLLCCLDFSFFLPTFSLPRLDLFSEKGMGLLMNVKISGYKARNFS